MTGFYVNQASQAKSPREAVLGLARAIDALYERLAEVEEKLANAGGWDDWGDDTEAEAWDEVTDDEVGPDGLTAAQREAHTRAIQAMQNTAAKEIALPAPSEEKMEARRMLERQRLKLAAALGADAGDIDWTEAYAKGGPWWLWQNRRDLVLSYDFDVRQMMVKDVLADSPELAHEMGLDILKQPSHEPDFETGAGSLTPQGWKENAPLLRSTT